MPGGVGWPGGPRSLLRTAALTQQSSEPPRTPGFPLLTPASPACSSRASVTGGGGARWRDGGRAGKVGVPDAPALSLWQDHASSLWQPCPGLLSGRQRNHWEHSLTPDPVWLGTEASLIPLAGSGRWPGPEGQGADLGWGISSRELPGPLGPAAAPPRASLPVHRCPPSTACSEWKCSLVWVSVPTGHGLLGQTQPGSPLCSLWHAPGLHECSPRSGPGSVARSSSPGTLTEPLLVPAPFQVPSAHGGVT